MDRNWKRVKVQSPNPCESAGSNPYQGRVQTCLCLESAGGAGAQASSSRSNGEHFGHNPTSAPSHTEMTQMTQTPRTQRNNTAPGAPGIHAGCHRHGVSCSHGVHVFPVGRPPRRSDHALQAFRTGPGSTTMGASNHVEPTVDLVEAFLHVLPRGTPGVYIGYFNLYPRPSMNGISMFPMRYPTL